MGDGRRDARIGHRAAPLLCAAEKWCSSTADETRESVIELHHFSAAQSDATIEALPLDAIGEVPWWSEEKRQVTLLQILTHMIAETARHAGHADIIREFIDGQAGEGPADLNLTQRSPEEWAAYRAQLEAAARAGK